MNKNCNNCEGFVPKSKNAPFNAFDYIAGNKVGCCVNVENVEPLWCIMDECDLWGNKKYKIIENFIKANRYTYKVEDILESYQKYWIKNYYTSYTMTHCIENLENEIKDLLGMSQK